MQPGWAQTSRLGVPLLPLAWWVGWVAPVRPTHGVFVLSCPSAPLRVCSVLGRLAPVHRCSPTVCCVASAVSSATWLLFTGVLARCVVLRPRCPGPLGSCLPVRPLGVLLCVCSVLGHLAPVHRCARSVCCVACAVSWATWLLFTCVPARCVVLRVRCPGPLGSCSPVCPLGVLCYMCGVLGHLAPVLRCARWVCCSVCGVLGHLAPVQGGARLVSCVSCAVSWATWLLFSGAPAGCVVVCAESWATWLLFTGAPARCVALRVRCPGPLGSCSSVRPLGVLLRVCGFLSPVAPVHRCALSVLFCVCCVLSLVAPDHRCAAPCVVLRVRCPGPLGSRSPVRPLRPLLCSCGVLGHLAPVHRCARSVCCVVHALSWATWLLFTVAPTRCVVLCVRCPGPLGSCSPVRPLGVLPRVCGFLSPVAPVHRCALSVLFCVCCVLSLVAPVHRYARSVCCVACAVSWATWLPFTGAPAPSFPLFVRCPGPLGSCSPVCPLSVLFCVCGVLGHLTAVHRCARSVLCFACALSRATWLLFTGVPARFVVLRVRCPGPPGSCSPVCSLGVLCCVCGVLGQLDPVHRYARSVGYVACTVSWAAWLLYTGVLALCAVLWVARVVLRGRGVAAGRSLVHPDGGNS